MLETNGMLFILICSVLLACYTQAHVLYNDCPKPLLGSHLLVQVFSSIPPMCYQASKGLSFSAFAAKSRCVGTCALECAGVFAALCALLFA